MEQAKSGEELLAEVYRNTHYALASIADILPATEEGALKEELLRMHGEYERIAEMMTQGTVMGITALTRSIRESEDADAPVRAVAGELLAFEQSCEQTLKEYL